MAPCSDNHQFTDSGRPESLLSCDSSRGPLHSTVISDSAHFSSSFHSTCSAISDTSSFYKIGHTCTHCCHGDVSIIDIPLGERPSCEGREDDVTMVSSDQASDLDTDWDNSALDASCTTCAEREFSLYSMVAPEEISEVAKPIKHLVFMKHTVTCPACTQGTECPTAQAMEQDLSSFFEVDLGEEYYDHTVSQAEEKPMKSTAFWSETSYAVETMQSSAEATSSTDYYSFMSDPTKSLKDVNLDDILMQSDSTTAGDTTFRSLSRCDSALTTSSDASVFMETALCKQPVTGSKCSTSSCRKSAILRKMKQFTKYVQQKRHGQNKPLKTLVVL